jgi:phage tail protein X
MADEYLEHRTSEGERWDLLAHRYYGDPNLMTTLIEANPHLAITATLPAGELLAVPILEDDAPTPDPQELPPWKR